MVQWLIFPDLDYSHMKKDILTEDLALLDVPIMLIFTKTPLKKYKIKFALPKLLLNWSYLQLSQHSSYWEDFAQISHPYIHAPSIYVLSILDWIDQTECKQCSEIGQMKSIVLYQLIDEFF